MIDETVRNAFRSALISAYFSARDVHKYAIAETGTTKGQMVACIYANRALSYLNLAKAIYINNYDDMQDDNIDGTLHQVEVFCNEVITCVATDHSHQWSDIEYNRMIEKLSHIGIQLVDEDKKSLL